MNHDDVSDGPKVFVHTSGLREISGKTMAEITCRAGLHDELVAALEMALTSHASGRRMSEEDLHKCIATLKKSKETMLPLSPYGSPLDFSRQSGFA